MKTTKNTKATGLITLIAIAVALLTESCGFKHCPTYASASRVEVRKCVKKSQQRQFARMMHRQWGSVVATR